MFKVITMSDSNYFDAGQLFLKTRNRIDADFILYGPDLTKQQINLLTKHNIEYKKVDKKLFNETMQYMKFELVEEQINIDKEKKYLGFTLVDFDTFFINDWKRIFGYDFDIGITVRPDQIKKKCLRAYANGGVVFYKPSSLNIIDYAKIVIKKGKDDSLIEYDEIWNTLEKGRPKEKTHYRTNLRWWSDQVFLSSLLLTYFKRVGYHKIGIEPIFFDVWGMRVGMFNCNNYNVLDSEPNIKIQKNIYIRHLKTKGRIKLVGKDVTKEKI